jgi:hypothetical protein
MVSGIEEVRHDAAALIRFIDSIASGCTRADEYPSYVPASRKFFDYVVAQRQRNHIWPIL